MSKNSATVIKDGQLAVATVPQTGTLVGAASEIDATALVETADGLQLCVKTCELGGGGGGGTVDQTYAPTSTNAQSGTAVAEAVAPALKNTATDTNSLAILGTSTGQYAVAIGKDSSANYSYSMALGHTARAYATGAVAIGYFTTAGKNYSIAIGEQSAAQQNYSIAIGEQAKSSANSAIQLGSGTNSTANSFQVFNYQMLDANGHIPNERIYYPQPLYKGYTITGSDVTVNDNNIASGFTSYGNQDNRNSYLLVNNKIPNSFSLLEMYVGFTCGNYNEDKGYSLITRNDSISTTWYVQGNSGDNTDYRIQRWNGTANVVGSTSLSKDQSYVARYIYNKTNGNTEQCDLYINGAWVNQWNNSNVTVTWNNIYVGIGGAYCYGDTSQTGSINLNQTAIYVDGVCLFNGVKNWIPSTAAITGVPGYDGTKTQVLKNVNGTLTWVDEA